MTVEIKYRHCITNIFWIKAGLWLVCKSFYWFLLCFEIETKTDTHREIADILPVAKPARQFSHAMQI